MVRENIGEIQVLVALAEHVVLLEGYLVEQLLLLLRGQKGLGKGHIK